jgi:hypothetical protein
MSLPEKRVEEIVREATRFAGDWGGQSIWAAKESVRRALSLAVGPDECVVKRGDLAWLRALVPNSLGLMDKYGQWQRLAAALKEA